MGPVCAECEDARRAFREMRRARAIARDIDNRLLCSKINETALAAGTYYLRVTTWRNETTLTYYLDVRVQ